MQIKQMLLTKNIYSRSGTAIGKITKVVVHYVANEGTSAENNRHYFEGLKVGKKDSKGNYRYASSHYIVGLNGEVIMCVPENEVAYHASQANRYSIGIEGCHPDSTGKFNQQTYNSLIELLADICTRYQLDPIQDIIRHYDVTGKNCPKYYVQDVNAWNKLKQDVRLFMDKNIDALAPINIEVHGKDLYSIPGIYLNDVNYIPVRFLENLGYEIGWNNNTKTILLNYRKKEAK